MRTVVLTRQELYEKVWKTPINILAPAEYNMTGNGLKKICKNNDIPVPYVGYWQKLEHGQKPAPIPLPPLVKGQIDKIVIFLPLIKVPSEAPAYAGELQAIKDFEAATENRIMVSDASEKFHPVVARTKRAFAGCGVDEYGMFGRSEKLNGILKMRISPGSFDRAMRIINALFLALETRGAKIIEVPDKEGNGIIVIRFKDVDTGIYIEELATRYDHIPTEEELEKQREWNKKYSFVWNLYHKYDYRPSGKLKLIMDYTSNFNGGILCQEKSSRPLEDKLNQFVVQLFHRALHVIDERRKDKVRELERQEREQKQTDLRKQAEEKRERVNSLLEMIENHDKAEKIRTFLKKMESLNLNIETHGMKWAYEYADEIDPLCRKSQVA